ncbi:MAG: ParB/RepB/Spo0J family partition protein [Burkholderiaceae bacterium]|nr:ParB/RepB/Spo0J family partition protein [Burkholderiaceae bacterium]
MSKPRTKGLGRGLDALLGSDDPAPGASGNAAGATLALAVLQPGRYQPRTRMDETALAELAASIARFGVMQPILVRPLGQDRYEIIAGERRYRAAQAAGLLEVPVIVRDVPDEQALAMALIENIQREDLNPLEQAQAVKRLIDEFRYTHEQAAEAIGRSRSATTNLLRLLNLADPVQTMLLAGDIDMGHARALLALDRASQIMTATQLVQRRLSVRETEKLVARQIAGRGDDASRGKRAHKRRASDPDRDVARLQERLAETLGTAVVLRQMANGRGQIVIDYSGPDQFDGLLQRLGLSLLMD